MKYIPEIDGLRAIAVLSVVIFHLFPHQLSGGFIGVDIFFVISGFLISSIIFNDLKKGTFSLKKFLSKRIRRIFPTLILVLMATLIVGIPILYQSELRALCKHIAGGAFFVSNFLFANEIGYFDGPAETKPLLHLWSLAIEEQFYIFWPPLLMLLSKKRKSIISVIFAIFALSLIGNVLLIKHLPEKLFFMPFSRFWQLLGGSIIAWFQAYRMDTITTIRTKNCLSIKNQNFIITLPSLLSTLGLALVFLGFFLLDGSMAYPGALALIPTVGAILIILGGQNAFFNKHFLSNKYLIYIGLISYPLYLWHWPIYTYARMLKGEHLCLKYSACVLIISLLLSFITYRYFENKIRYSKRKYTTHTLALVILTIGITNIFIYKNDGKLPFISKSNSIQNSAQRSPLRKAAHLSNKRASLKNSPKKYFFDNAEIAVIGNSHAVELAHAFATKLRPYKRGIYHYTMSSAIHNHGIISELEHTNETHVISYLWHEKILSEIKANDKITTVIFSYRNEHFTENDIYLNSLATMLNELSLKKQVIYVLQAPLLEKHIFDYIPRLGKTDTSIGAVTLDTWEKDYSNVISTTNLLNDSIIVINPTDHFCRGDICYAVLDGKALYFDDDHMSLDGAALIAENIIELIPYKSDHFQDSNAAE